VERSQKKSEMQKRAGGGLVVLLSSSSSPFTTPRLLRIGKLLKYAKHNAKYYGLLITSMVMVMGAHIFVCLWVLLHHNCSPDSDGNILASSCQKAELLAAYLEALFYIICLMIGVSTPPLLKGSGIFDELTATSATEETTPVSTYLLGAFIVLTGFALFAILLAHVQVVISGWNQVEAKFRTKMVG
jgi:ABC-type multidrug transport system fused ATPase/permease subunit